MQDKSAELKVARQLGLTDVLYPPRSFFIIFGKRLLYKHVYDAVFRSPDIGADPYLVSMWLADALYTGQVIGPKENEIPSVYFVQLYPEKREVLLMTAIDSSALQ